MIQDSFLPFSRPSTGDEEIREVAEVIKSGWLTTGPRTAEFERMFADMFHVKHALGVNSATAGLHLGLLALGVGPGDEVITTPMTFAATVNTIMMTGAVPVLADIEPRTFNISPAAVEPLINARTKAIVPVHFAGLPTDIEGFRALSEKHRVPIMEDCAHALGAEYGGRPVGCAPMPISVFSFHPTKNITTGEGGIVLTDDDEIADTVSVLRQHGMSKGAWNRYASSGVPQYEVVAMGYKYNMLDMEAAVGICQLRKLPEFQAARTHICHLYDCAFSGLPGITLPPTTPTSSVHGRHIYCPLINTEHTGFSRNRFMEMMKERNIGTALHYQAIHQHRFYAERYGLRDEQFPAATDVSNRIVSLPLFPSMTNDDVNYVIEAVRQLCA